MALMEYLSRSHLAESLRMRKNELFRNSREKGFHAEGQKAQQMCGEKSERKKQMELHEQGWMARSAAEQVNTTL